MPSTSRQQSSRRSVSESRTQTVLLQCFFLRSYRLDHILTSTSSLPSSSLASSITYFSPRVCCVRSNERRWWRLHASDCCHQKFARLLPSPSLSLSASADATSPAPYRLPCYTPCVQSAAPASGIRLRFRRHLLPHCEGRQRHFCLIFLLTLLVTRFCAHLLWLSCRSCLPDDPFRSFILLS